MFVRPTRRAVIARIPGAFRLSPVSIKGRAPKASAPKFVVPERKSKGKKDLKALIDAHNFFNILRSLFGGNVSERL